jgi:4'-phosphopantetheinyl transferase
VTLLPPHEIHLYYQRFDTLYPEIAPYQNLLSHDEQQRANQFHFEADKHRFILARGALRTVLASYLKCDPKTLVFEYGGYGKPALKDHALQFNISHTKVVFLIACHAHSAIGVDLELMTREKNYAALGAHIFSPAEQDYFLSHPIEKQGAAFFRAWARKEAFIKALGLGMSIDLKSISLTIDGDLNLFFRYKNKTWQIDDLPIRDDHSIALAIESAIPETKIWIEKNIPLTKK